MGRMSIDRNLAARALGPHGQGTRFTSAQADNHVRPWRVHHSRGRARKATAEWSVTVSRYMGDSLHS